MDSTNFDKLINSSQNIVPKRLSFDFLNNSPMSSFSRKLLLHSCKEQFFLNIFILIESPAKKRKYEETELQPQTSNSRNGTKADESLNSSTGSLCASWETKLLRSDLIEAQSRVSWHSIRYPFISVKLNTFVDHSTQERDSAPKYNPI
jgi:hypothetical protein